jgi:adenine-specific DNA-methyltransferase
MPILNWLTREDDVKATQQVPYRLLEEVPELSYGDKDTENMLIQGDNLEALKALLPFYAGQVKCIYIDPPYNTKSAFEQYDDNLEHSKWLSTIWPRLELLRELLADDGSIWISIDDNEAHYLKVILDEIFGRKNFIASNTWQKRYSRENREAIGDVHEYIFVYSKNPAAFKKQRNKVPLTEEQAKIYRNPNKDPKGRWRTIPMTAQAGHATPDQFYTITAPSGKEHQPPEGRCWGLAERTYKKLLEEGRIYFGKNGDAQPNTIRYLSEVEGMTPWTWWPSNEVGHTDEAKKEIHALFGKKSAFDTPKPERLLERILHIATNEGDLVLDSFLGSGTTSAVAHKMKRKHIGIEMGDHAKTNCQPRLKKVIDGEEGGVSDYLSWQGGGGFRFYQLGANAFDETGRICADISFPVLAAHIWFSETSKPWNQKEQSPVIGIFKGKAYALLYNGILGDRRPQGGNVLTGRTLQIIRDEIKKFEYAFSGEVIVYGESSRMGDSRLKIENIIFKQTPYDVKAR